MKTSVAAKVAVLSSALVLGCSSCSTPQAPSTQPAVTQSSGQQSRAAAGVTPAAPARDIPDCPATPAEIKEAMGAIVGPGEVVINEKYTANDTCTYTLPPGSLAEPGSGGKVFTGADEASLVVWTHAYADNFVTGSAVYDVERDFGGSTPEEILESTYVAEKDINTAQRGKKVGEAVKRIPSIGQGAVSDGFGQFTVAGNGKYWYRGGISGVKGSAAYEQGILNVAALLADKG